MGTVCQVVCVASLVTGVQLIAPVVTPACAAVDTPQNTLPSEQLQILSSARISTPSHFNSSQGQLPRTLDDYEPPSGIGSPGGSGGGSGTR